ncbi:unnamed protein product [Macrosiphum euphorbiae]|uniref:Regulatory protein zeste n=1 Tax=Macrosiphum euphorbiae TaxID=13131 RepID=A0AAV0XLL6_9HEMI|nr:unnamed protein product [Macrosiphum euphorbiae]
MTSIQVKRTRTKNFSEQEKELLITLITPYKHIIENIKTDGFNVKQKNQSWAVVTSQFNDRVESGSRTVQQLKTVYDMIKRQTKKNLSNENVNLYFLLT